MGRPARTEGTAALIARWAWARVPEIVWASGPDSALPELLDGLDEADGPVPVIRSPWRLSDFPGRVVLWIATDDGFTWLNRCRPAVANARVTLVIWSTEAEADRAHWIAPDIETWTTHRMRLPAGPARYADAALAAGGVLGWTGAAPPPDLGPVFEVGHQPYAALLAAAGPGPRVWRVRDRWEADRARWAWREAGEGTLVLWGPDEPGWSPAADVPTVAFPAADPRSWPEDDLRELLRSGLDPRRAAAADDLDRAHAAAWREAADGLTGAPPAWWTVHRVVTADHPEVAARLAARATERVAECRATAAVDPLEARELLAGAGLTDGFVDGLITFNANEDELPPGLRAYRRDPREEALRLRHLGRRLGHADQLAQAERRARAAGELAEAELAVLYAAHEARAALEPCAGRLGRLGLAGWVARAALWGAAVQRQETGVAGVLPDFPAPDVQIERERERVLAVRAQGRDERPSFGQRGGWVVEEVSEFGDWASDELFSTVIPTAQRLGPWHHRSILLAQLAASPSRRAELLRTLPPVTGRNEVARWTWFAVTHRRTPSGALRWGTEEARARIDLFVHRDEKRARRCLKLARSRPMRLSPLEGLAQLDPARWPDLLAALRTPAEWADYTDGAPPAVRAEAYARLAGTPLLRARMWRDLPAHPDVLPALLGEVTRALWADPRAPVAPEPLVLPFEVRAPPELAGHDDPRVRALWRTPLDPGAAAAVTDGPLAAALCRRSARHLPGDAPQPETRWSRALAAADAAGLRAELDDRLARSDLAAAGVWADLAAVDAASAAGYRRAIEQLVRPYDLALPA